MGATARNTSPAARRAAERLANRRRHVDTRRAAARRIVRAVEEAVPPDRLWDVFGAVGGPAGGAPTTDATEWHRRLLRRVFGLGLGFVARKRHLDTTVVALHEGDPDALAAMDDEAATLFLADPTVIRNARKLAAARHNAAVVVALRETFGGLDGYVAALDGETAAPLLDDLRDRMRLVGPVSAARLAQDLGCDVLVPHPAVLRTLVRLGWLDDPRDTAATQALAAEVAPRPPAGVGPRLGRFSVALLAFATGRWTRDPICGETPACDRCPVAGACARAGVE